ncbi:hypothetical protein IGI04_015660 [Brassica rapa subsp. trilocularis]|uniref:NAC domain-containing protein n=3 Tax=Brassica TaxID=3705 RepID=A0ABQ8DJ84_BRANA|nr:hypothetical protein IGI04_015660 [Brassica rapa subsp. trilocularis]KAH0929411.1 hypothetical protein HID58_015138 [Brassica napus]
MELKLRGLPVGFRFRPTDCEISKYLLTKNVMEEQPMKIRNVRYVPEECHDIFSKHPRDLPGYPRETDLYFYCKKLSSEVTTNSHSIWKQIGEDTDVLDPKNNDALVGIKRPFTLVDHEEESDDILLSDEDEPSQYNWFMDEISLPLTVSETDWVLCHVFRKIKPEFESKEEEEEEESVFAKSLDLLRENDGNVLPPSHSPP